MTPQPGTGGSTQRRSTEVSTTSHVAEGIPTLDRDAEIWVGTFPGLGSVRVHPDGLVDVDAADRPEDDRDTVEQREHALRYGWGEPLSFARRGLRQAHGGAVGPVESETCLLVLGDPHDVVIVLIELTQLAWGALGDRPTPLQWDGQVLTAHPRSAPIVASKRRAAKADLVGTQVRGDTDAVALDLPRISEPRRVAAVVSMQMRKPDEDAFTPLTGHERFETAAGLFMHGALWPEVANGEAGPGNMRTTGIEGQGAAEPADATGADTVATAAADQAERDTAAAAMLADHLALSRLPAARLRFDSATKDDDVASLLAWWHALAGSS